MRDWETPNRFGERRKKPIKRHLCKTCAKKYEFQSTGSPWLATLEATKENL